MRRLEAFARCVVGEQRSWKNSQGGADSYTGRTFSEVNLGHEAQTDLQGEQGGEDVLNSNNNGRHLILALVHILEFSPCGL